MNTFTVLSGFTVDTLQGYLNDSNTWVEFKLKCGLPKSRRQDGLRAYLDNVHLDYSHLPSKGQSGMQQKSELWTIPEEKFREYVSESQNWTELLQACGFEGLGNIRTVRRRIKSLEINVDHFKANKKTAIPEDVFSEDVKVSRSTLLKLLLAERDHICSICKQTEHQDQPIPLKVVRLNRKARDNRKENLALRCPNCITAFKKSGPAGGETPAATTQATVERA